MASDYGMVPSTGTSIRCFAATAGKPVSATNGEAAKAAPCGLTSEDRPGDAVPSASEVVELSDRGSCENIALRELVFVTYVIQLGVTHVLPLRLPTRRRSGVPPTFYLALLHHRCKDDGEAEDEPG